jgi:hypothetical protein
VGIVCTKGRREQMWKHVINLVMIQWKCASNTKQQWNLTVKLKILNYAFIKEIVIYDGAYEFSMFGHAHFFLSLIVLCTHLRCYTTSDVYIVMYILCKTKQLKELMNQKRKNIIFSSIYVLTFFLAKKYFDMCFDSLIKLYTSHH